MSEATTVYRTRVSGLWNSRHEIRTDEGPVGVMTVRRNGLGMVVGGEYRPEKGEVLVFKRGEGLLRSQFMLWTDNQEWLGSSLRPSFVKREVSLYTGGKPFRLVPVEGFGKGWSLFAPKTGVAARMRAGFLGRDSTLEVFRRVDFPTLLFAYFLGGQIYRESVWPGPDEEEL